MSKLDEMLVYALLVIGRDPALDDLVEQDAVTTSPQLQQLADEFLLPILEDGQRTGVIRLDISGTEIAAWFLDTTADLVPRHLDEVDIRRRFRLFIKPALLHNEPSAATLAVLTKTEQHLRDALETLHELHGTARADGQSD